MKSLVYVLCLILSTVYAHAEEYGRPRSTCDFELESVLALSDGAESIECHTPLFYRTLFKESEFQFGIFMTCNGDDMPSCKEAATRLATLTNSGPCRDNFYRSLIEAAPSDTRSSVFESQLWLPFALKTRGGEILFLPVTFPEDTEQVDCQGPLNVLQYELSKM